MYKKETLKYLENLKKNNNKTWFDSHKKEYETAREDHLDFVSKLISGVGKFEEEIKKLQPKECVYRIYRDVRFSKDKTPYKTHFAAYLSPGGKKSVRAGYYFHLEPGNAFLGGGMWEPQPLQLKAIRQEIDYNTDEFNEIINSADFKKYYDGLSGSKLAKAPKDYPKDHPAIELLKYKDFIVTHKINDEQLTSPKLLETCLKAFAALYKFNLFLDRTLE